MRFFWVALTLGGIAGCSPSMDDINATVLRDSIVQYNMAAQSGTPIDRCVQAGLVVAAASQAQNHDAYAQWVKTRTSKCKEAGVAM